jgi:chromosomal replication initiator protein
MTFIAVTMSRIDTIASAVADYYDVPLALLLGPSRLMRTAKVRFVAMYVTRKVTDYPLFQIGLFFSRDHSTVMNACQRIEKLMATDAELAAQVKVLIQRFAARPFDDERDTVGHA